MSAGPLLDQSRARSLLEQALRSGHLADAWLFVGPPGVGKEEAALALARALVCAAAPAAGPDLFAPLPVEGGATDRPRLGGCGACESCLRIDRYAHPDVIVRLPLPRPKEGGPADPSEALAYKAQNPYRDPPLSGGNLAIGIEDVRAVRRGLGYPPVEAEARVIVFREAERMTEDAQNALLKSLEEPPADTCFILTTSQPEALLPTIRSRCRTIPFGPLPAEVIAGWLRERGLEPKTGVPDPAVLARGSLKRALRILEEGVPGRDEALRLLEEAATGRRRPALERAAGLVFRSAGDAYNDARSLLDELLSQVRDLAALQAGEVGLLNPDLADRLSEVAGRVPPAAVLQALEATTRARREVDGFVNLALIYATLSEALSVLAAGGAAVADARSR